MTKRFAWPRNTTDAVALPQPDHPQMLLVANEIIEHARVGRAAFNARRFADAKYQRDCCALLLWRLSVDGVTADGQLKLDGAKWETRLPGRLSSAAARAIRDTSALTNRSQSALVRHLEPDHIVPRNCVAEVLIRPGWLDLDDFQAALGFLNSHAEIAVLAPQENQHLADSNLKSKMPESWWDAPLGEKHALRFARYAAAKIAVTPWIGKMDLRSAQGPGCDDG